MAGNGNRIRTTGKNKLILDKLFTQTAKWDATANKWWIGETVTYRWTDSKNKPTSDWMDLDNALEWIQKHDGNK